MYVCVPARTCLFEQMNRTEEIVQERVVEAKRNMDQTILAAQKDAETRTALARMDCDEIVKKIKKKNADLIQRWQKEQALRRKCVVASRDG